VAVGRVWPGRCVVAGGRPAPIEARCRSAAGHSAEFGQAPIWCNLAP
jgi:hypothetical protein